jgi:hypothetical protein
LQEVGIAIALLLICLVIVLLFGRGIALGVSTLVGLSGTRVPDEARSLSDIERREQTKERARAIVTAIHEFRDLRGRLPTTLEELVPVYLPAVPVSLTSTMPFQYAPKPSDTFDVSWELHPNAMYEREWIDQDGQLHIDG